jgi:hypothetical protein
MTVKPVRMAEQPVKWRIETSDRYNKIVTSVISTATGAFLLPVLFLRQFLGISAEKALKPYFNWVAGGSWACLIPLDCLWVDLFLASKKLTVR